MTFRFLGCLAKADIGQQNIEHICEHDIQQYLYIWLVVCYSRHVPNRNTVSVLYRDFKIANC